MQEGYKLCKDPDVGPLKKRMDLAVKYLKDTIDNLSNPYAVAMASYALTNANITEKNSILFKFLHEGGYFFSIIHSLHVTCTQQRHMLQRHTDRLEHSTADMSE